jgi:hypothetical protein
MTRLLLAVAALSVVDLVVTLTYMKTVGMYEANPIVHFIAGLGNPLLTISLFKIATVAIGIGLLHTLRRFQSARIAAALMVVVLLALSAQWARYGAQIVAIDVHAHQQHTNSESGWIHLDSTGSLPGAMRK